MAGVSEGGERDSDEEVHKACRGGAPVGVCGGGGGERERVGDEGD